MDEKEFSVINIIPFVDIMLVLLTIVLTTSTFIARGSIPIELPRASIQDSEVLKTRTIEISYQGRIFFNGAEATLEELSRHIDELDRETPILIRADREATIQIFVDVMDALKNMGFRRVSLQTEPKN
jgi:biopolymer transport protein ExbD